VRCVLCPRGCRLADGQAGFCTVRENRGGRLVLTTWGRTTGFAVDPIEKKPLSHFHPGATVLSFGTAGCNLGCRFCQNWSISKSRETFTLADEASPEAIARAAARHGCRSVAFTYNDPVVFLEYAVDVAKACRAKGIKAVAVTAGEVLPAPRAELFQWMDAANVDLKAFTEGFYRDVCFGELQPVLDTLVYLRRETNVWVEITNLMIPGKNDSPEETDAMTRWIVKELGPEVPVHFTAFHPDFRMNDIGPTKASTLRRARQIAMRNGVRYAYTGNVIDPEGSLTRCVCGEPLIAREGYDIVKWNLAKGGRCPSCGALCAGVFENEPGRWGNRRQKVAIAESAA
jgi:pyruvate formate lyase activating enzyme